ncbi:PHA/PHB synthase family protein [Streptomyces sp. NPDC091272]|uniref:PHA/PHB synthase family protein n=1 Tax=Streptomyces sp. NPDC091272 TaxID=3365981 RepID=UPI00382034AB
MKAPSAKRPKAPSGLQGRLAGPRLGSVRPDRDRDRDRDLDRDLDPDDRRFDDPAWVTDPGYRALLTGYLTWRRLVLAAAETPYLTARRREQVRLLATLLTDATAPTNTLAGNPAVLRRAALTRGTSLFRGAGNLLDDLRHRRGRPAKMRPGAFTLGETLAATPGQVVYRNDLMELIQYEPQTARVRQVPLLFLPAWVNKYYINDLAPGRSLVEWVVREGFTVFTVSLRNPGPAQAGLGLDEYFAGIPLRALDVVREITASPSAHLAGVCAGGMLAAATAAWHAADGERPVATLTSLVSSLDHPDRAGSEQPPDVELRALTRLLSRRGGLVDGRRISLLFDLLRARDTVWQPLVAGWLLGERPDPFDIWAWSEDAIDVPRTLFHQTLHMATHNTLARGELRLHGRDIDLAAVTQDTFMVAGSRDHIVPWETVYSSARLLGGDVAFHLIPSGHAGSVISPPRPGALYRTGPARLSAHPQDWWGRSCPVPGSWWPAWTRWLGLRSGPGTRSRPPGSAHHPPLAPAPGRYVRTP